MDRNLLVPGNIDITNRPVLRNADGSVSTEVSMSIGTDRGEVLIPQIINGQKVSPQEAIDHFRRSGEHLGIFNGVDAANKFAEALHNREPSPMQSYYENAPEINALTARRPATFDEKVGFAKTIGNYIRQNMMGQDDTTGSSWDNRVSGKEQPGIYAEPLREFMMGEIDPGKDLPAKMVRQGKFTVQLGTWKGSVVDVYKNPTRGDYQSSTKRFWEKYPDANPKYMGPKTRSTVDTEGNEYQWMAGDATHEMIESQLKKLYNLSSNQNNSKKIMEGPGKNALFKPGYPKK
jgi:hypothetical protein